MTAAPTIRDVRVSLIEAPLAKPIVVPIGTLIVRRCLVVTVELDDGALGFGEIWANFPPWGCHDRVEIVRRIIRPALRGESLDDPARLHDRLAAAMRPLANQWGAPGPFQQALAGVDIALWDARARWLGKSLCDVIAHAVAPRSVAVYATNLPIGEPETIRDVMRAGHTRFKVRLPQDRKIATEGLRAWRAAAGEHALMADATQGYTLERLRPILPDLVDARLTWLEEPFAVDDAAAYRSWKDVAGRPPTAMGENSYGIDGFDRLLADCDPDIVQPDITKTGGITRGRLICERMLGAGKPVCLHMYGGPVGLYASAHLMAALAGSMWLEMEATPNPIFARLLNAPPVVAGGALVLPDAPGIGVALDVGAIRAGDVTDL